MRPDGAHFKRGSLSKFPRFRDGQQPKLREIYFVKSSGRFGFSYGGEITSKVAGTTTKRNAVILRQFAG